MVTRCQAYAVTNYLEESFHPNDWLWPITDGQG